MRRTTTLLIVRTVEEDDFPTARTVIETTAERLPESSTRVRIPTDMLPPPLQRLAAWVRK